MADLSQERSGRPRRYDLSPLAGFADPRIGYAAAALDEETERLHDLVADLPREVLHFVPANTYLSAARLVKHMVWAECAWVSRLSGRKPPEDLSAAVRDSSLESFSQPPNGAETGPELVSLSRGMRETYSFPQLRLLSDIDAPFAAETGPRTVREVLMHLIWHWTYHTGQVGFALLAAGSEYVWTFDGGRRAADGASPQGGGTNVD